METGPASLWDPFSTPPSDMRVRIRRLSTSLKSSCGNGESNHGIGDNDIFCALSKCVASSFSVI